MLNATKVLERAAEDQNLTNGSSNGIDMSSPA
jgi:hypothetical protein